MPSLVFLTDDLRTPDPLPAVHKLPRGSLVIVRARQSARRVALADAVSMASRRRGLLWLVADDPELARRSSADGAHFPEAHIVDAFGWRARRPDWLITCAAHSLDACARIARTGATAALLSPVFQTESHDGGHAMGPVRVRTIASQSPVPVYALGGINGDTSGRLRGARLAGLAAVGALAK